jgi:hypothetical protein
LGGFFEEVVDVVDGGFMLFFGGEEGVVDGGGRGNFDGAGGSRGIEIFVDDVVNLIGDLEGVAGCL